jgi:NodT family efflux transporter outer membrane factor (OMF) lipoprotein
MKRSLRLAAGFGALACAGCNLAPTYTPPHVAIPAHFKEGGSDVWRPAAPSDDKPRGPWWTVFDDPLLDELEPQVDTANETLAAALANYEEARTQVQAAEAGLYPTLDQDTSLSGNRQSNNRPLRSPSQPTYYGNNSLYVQSVYEVDLWGRVRNTISANAAEAQAQAALLENVRLSLHAQVASQYVALRGLDRELALLRDTIKAYQAALTLTQNRLAGKIASPIDVSRAQSQLEAARALYADTQGRRATFEHAIATLVGKPASAFSIPSQPVIIHVPHGPARAPSTLLERRPDIANAEREVAAANEGIGVAKAAFYPRVFINLQAGTNDTGLHLLDLNNAFFSLGPSVDLPIFDGGRRAADFEAARARLDQKAAVYRATFLRAVQEVEDALAQEHYFLLEGRRLEAAVAAQKKVLDLSLTLYRDGATSYLDVVTAQTALLDEQRASLAVVSRRLNAAVALFVALGGGWATDEVATVGQP